MEGGQPQQLTSLYLNKGKDGDDLQRENDGLKVDDESLTVLP